MKTKLTMITLLAATSLFSSTLKEISLHVDKINNAKDLIVKQELIIELNKEVEKLDKTEAQKAQIIIDEKLILSK